MKKQKNIFFNILVINILSVIFFTFCLNFALYSSTNMEHWNRCSNHFTPEDSVKNDKKRKKEKVENHDKQQKDKKKITFETFEKNYVRAMRFYNNQQYLSAARIFEELYPLTLGTPYADTILFTFANCYYMNGDYELAAFHFKDYSRRYAGIPKAEEAYFLCVKSIYNLSPSYSLDQFETKYAIEEIDYFFKQYPASRYREECNVMLDQLREKLAKKDFEATKLYYYTENYAAVQIYVKNFMKDHPASNLVPEAYYLLVRNNFDFARKSVESKQLERYLQCLDAFTILKTNHAGSPFVEQAAKYAVDAEKAIEKINAKKQR